MPILLDRRGFLATAAGLLASRAFGAPTSAELHWALLSDTHIAADIHDANRGFLPFENLKLAVAQSTAKPFDGYVVNGDLARLAGHPEDYQRFRESIAPLLDKAPVALSLGNHDDRTNAIAALSVTAGSKEPIADKWVSVIDAGPLRVILLDSLYKTNVTPGFLGKAQRDWLNAYLSAHTDRPVLVFVHHTLDDGDTSLLDSDRMLAILKPHRHVKAVFYGHSHEYKFDVIDGLHLVNLPAVGYNFEDSAPVGWVDASMDAKGARLTLHAFGGNRAQDRQTRALTWR